jgi:quercetin dioxygenase-like cupin family protein
MSNDTEYTYYQDLLAEVEMPKDGILSRPILKNERLQVTLFAMAPGAEMTEHTTSMEAIVHVLSGEAEISFAGQEQKAGPGTWLRMAPRLPHSITANTGPVVFQLILLRN